MKLSDKIDVKLDRWDLLMAFACGIVLATIFGYGWRGHLGHDGWCFLVGWVLLGILAAAVILKEKLIRGH